MARFILAPSAALFALLALTAAPVAAQNTYPFQQPNFGLGYQTPLSPYLNLLRGGDASANYYLGVEKEFQRRQDRSLIYGNLQGINQQLLPQRPGLTNADIDTPLRSTGHPTGFGYTGTYFGGSGGMVRSPGSPFGAQGSRNTAAPAGKAPPKTR